MERLKTAAAKISGKLIPYVHTKHPNIMIERIRLYNHSVVIINSGPLDKIIDIRFDNHLNFDLSSLPQMDIFFRYLADEIIRKYPLPEHEYVMNKTTQTGNRELVGYKYRQTDANTYDNSKEVRFGPIYETSSYEQTTHEIIKKKSQNQSMQSPGREVL